MALAVYLALYESVSLFPLDFGLILVNTLSDLILSSIFANFRAASSFSSSRLDFSLDPVGARLCRSGDSGILVVLPFPTDWIEEDDRLLPIVASTVNRFLPNGFFPFQVQKWFYSLTQAQL
jgi:hypothetical protein